MVGETMGWFERDIAQENVNACTKLETKIINSLLNENMAEIKAKDKTQMLAYTTKSKDQNARLIQFSQGAPDSRKEITVGQLLPALTPEELTIFDGVLARLEGKTPTDTGGQSPLVKH